MVFENDDEFHMYYIPNKTFMLMEGNARYRYKHGIRRYKTDIVDNREIDREIRYSITFRNVVI